MKYGKLKLLLSSAALVISVLNVHAQMKKEGQVSFTIGGIGTPTMIQVSERSMSLNYDTSGIFGEPGASGLNGMAAIRCVGSALIVDGKWDNERGACQSTYPDGDTVTTTYTGKGSLSTPATGEWTFVGGTGKLKGIAGNGTWTRIPGPDPKEGQNSSMTMVKGSYKLP